ncbi:hypothetical protein QQS21_002985 [Conoideocrella luteorostrata]|uniref:Uncharacterized protein n=1 Tax=Conoideocrella luteorostrata TaxID=1105319 RepID=A0AAJ0FWU3_9HYPO|nr:hypothetical protein QQS21_002985 [Conoideocrella luteorostrata]
MNADRIVVVEHGQVVEQGSHNELIKANGRYADLWSKQVFLQPRENPEIIDFRDDRSAMADDMSSEHTATELGRSGGMDSDSEAMTADEEQTDSKQAGAEEDRKQGYAFNPVAPEFTPQRLQNAGFGPKTSCSENSGAGHQNEEVKASSSRQRKIEGVEKHSVTSNKQ